jgi:hypothetical protein
VRGGERRSGEGGGTASHPSCHPGTATALLRVRCTVFGCRFMSHSLGVTCILLCGATTAIMRSATALIHKDRQACAFFLCVFVRLSACTQHSPGRGPPPSGKLGLWWCVHHHSQRVGPSARAVSDHHSVLVRIRGHVTRPPCAPAYCGSASGGVASKTSGGAHLTWGFAPPTTGGGFLGSCNELTWVKQAQHRLLRQYSHSLLIACCWQCARRVSAC